MMRQICRRSFNIALKLNKKMRPFPRTGIRRRFFATEANPKAQPATQNHSSILLSVLSDPIHAYKVRYIEFELDGLPQPAIFESITTSKKELITTYNLALQDLRVIYSNAGQKQDEDSITEDEREDNTHTYNTEDSGDISPQNFELIKKYVTPEFFIRDKAFIAHLGCIRTTTTTTKKGDATALLSDKECLLFNDPLPYIQQKFLFTLNQKLIEYRTLHSNSEHYRSVVVIVIVIVI
ncbi:hypothetical protein RFI_11146, partial [Reticulomyxa filosa]